MGAPAPIFFWSLKHGYYLQANAIPYLPSFIRLLRHPISPLKIIPASAGFDTSSKC